MKCTWMFKFAIVATLTSGCATRKHLPKPEPKDNQRVSVMTFNVENLFDVEDDPETNDEAFLPARLKTSQVFQNKCRFQNQDYKDSKDKEPESDEDISKSTFRMDECLGKNWDERILERKMARLTDVVKQVNRGEGPDIILLQEVENRAIVEQWRDKYLKKMGYQTLLHLDSPDERGIDTAILTRFEAIAPPVLHLIDFSKEAIEEDDRRPTRGILEGRVKLPDGSPLALFSLHFPSQGASTLHRKAAVKTLMEVAAKVPVGTPVVIGGDFNITSIEEFKQKYFKDLVAKDFAISHKIGCKDCPGTTYYKEDNTWSFFDVLLFSKPMMDEKSPWRVDPDSIQLVNSSRYQTDSWGKPAKFRTGKSTVGVSDHWPVYAELFTTSPTKTAGAPQ